MPPGARLEKVLHGEQGGAGVCCVFFEPVPEAGREPETCVITGEELSLNTLQACENESLFEDQPRLSAVALPCAHKFNALALVYHWLYNTMRCPLCKAGQDSALAKGSFSSPWALRCEQEIQAKHKQQYLFRMQDEDNSVAEFLFNSHLGVLPELTLSRAVGELRGDFIMQAGELMPAAAEYADDTIPLSQFAYEVCTAVYLFGNSGQNGLRMTTLRLLMRPSDGLLNRDNFITLYAHSRALCRALASQRPTHLRFVTYACNPGGGVTQLGASPLLDVESLEGSPPIVFTDEASDTVFTVTCGFDRQLVASIHCSLSEDTHLILV